MDAKQLRIVFMGTPEFAVCSLRALVENGYNVVGVVTSPDKPAGRGQQLHQSDVKRYAQSVGLHVMQPEKLRSEAFLAELGSLNADLGIVIAFRMLPEVVWAMPRLGTFNLHASLLPQYRGAAPINWAIINGETTTGVTTFMLNHDIDTGDIIAQTEVAISESDNAGSLHDKLMEEGKSLVLQTVEAIASNNVHPIAQRLTAQIKSAPKIFKEDCRIDWHASGEQIVRLVRGLSPYPAAWSPLYDNADNETSFKAFDAKFVKGATQKCGSIVTDGKTFGVQCADGTVFIEQLQPAGKRRMAAQEWLRGVRNINEMYCSKL